MKKLIFLAITLITFSCTNTTKEEKNEEKVAEETKPKQETTSPAVAPLSVGIRVGDVAPEIYLPDLNGKSISLYSLRGKYVLVDFWASWCGPCRYENPNLVKLYNEYKDKGLEIYGVSLDQDKDSWHRAIQKDGITWIQVSDLNQWNSIVVPLYQLEGIPASFLLDKEGKIIASYLRGPDLENKVKQLLGE